MSKERKEPKSSTIELKKKDGKAWYAQHTFDHREIQREFYGASISTVNIAAGSTNPSITGTTTGGPNSVQVVIIDENGTVIATLPQPVSVAAGGTWSVTFIFIQSPFQAGTTYYVVVIGTDQTTGMSAADSKQVGPL
jgi:hypothetical protein